MDPPLLLIVTPGATSVLDDVAPDVVVLSVAVVAAPADVDPALVEVDSTADVALDEGAVPVLDVAADPVDDSPDDGVLDVEPTELDDEDDSEDVPVVSAAATP